MSVLGIDIGTRFCGLVAINGGTIIYGKLLKQPSLSTLWATLIEVNNTLSLDLIICEQPYYHKNVHSALVLAEQIGVIKLFCQINNINFLQISPSKVKKLISGKGNAPKEIIKKFTKIRLQDPHSILNTDNWDISDATAIALAGEIIKQRGFNYPNNS